jgi:hypothetical protein
MVGSMSAVEYHKGESPVGEYLVQIARPTSTGWVAGIPPLNATITNRRLILVPQTRRPHPPASIPSLYILKINEMLLSHRQAVQIRLKNNYDLNLFVGWSQGIDFVRQLHNMITPSLRKGYTPALEEQDLMRIIQQINNL